nr:HAMP domain-containing sensor histidine kinase [Methylobacterium brachythecii]
MRSIEDVEDVVSSAFYVVLAISALLGLLAGVILSTGLLRRVDRVTHAAEAIIAGDLTRRIEITEAGDEFDHLSSTLNTMLDRINGLMESLHQVSNDIAHDLRTPLARLRQNLEEARTRAETTVQYEAAVDKAIAEADGLLATFSALLRIAQIDAGTRRSAFTRVDLSECLQTVAEAYLPSIEDNGRSLSCSIEPDLLVEGDDQLLTQLFSNLLENAIGHTPSGTAIRLELCQHAAGAGIAAVIADDGPGIPADEAKKVFRRFYRLEKSRSTPGNGLGLSAVAAIVDLHKAKIVLADNRPGLRVKIIFPNKS